MGCPSPWPQLGKFSSLMIGREEPGNCGSAIPEQEVLGCTEKSNEACHGEPASKQCSFTAFASGPACLEVPA